jgi:peptide/nickel transport system substrate-binding protein
MHMTTALFKKFIPAALARTTNYGARRGMRFLSLVLSCSLLATPALAQKNAGDCGTVVIPPGLGIGPGADVTSFNPLFLTSLYNQEASSLIFEQLLWFNDSHEIDWAHSIASAVTTPDNGKTYDVTLRPWSWSDGVPVTSADVLYAFQLIRDYGTNYAAYGQGGIPYIIASMTAPDASHIHIVLTHAVNPQWFIYNGLAQLQPLPEHVWSKFTPDEIWQGQSDPKFFRVADGPLLLKKLTVGVDAEFVPNPLYGGGKMHFSRFVMKFENSEGQELQAVESGDLDMSNIPFDLYDKATHLPGNYTVTMRPSYSWEEISPNMLNKSTPYFADVRVRQAMADAIDENRIIQLAMHGHGEAVRGPVPPYPPSFLSPDERAGNYPVGYNPAKAKALLAAAGFSPGPDGILQKNGKPFSFVLQIPAGQALRIEMAETVQQDLRAVGIDMQVRQVEFNQLLTEMVNEPQAWQAILIAEDIGAYPTGEELFATGGYLNNTGYSNPQMDKIIAQSTDEPGMGGLFAYEDFASAQEPLIFLPDEVYSVLVRNGLHGVEDFLNTFGYNWAPEKLYCDAR